MKVFFLLDQMGGGGAEKAFKLVAEELSLDPQYDVTMVLLADIREYELADRVRCVSMVKELNIYTAPQAFYRYLSFLRHERPDVLFSTNSKAILFSMVARKLTNTHTVPVIQLDLAAHYRNRPLMLKSLLYSLYQADALCFISRGIYDNISNKLPKKSLFFIPNPINLQEIEAKKTAEIEPSYRHIFEKPVLINVARLNEQKNQQCLLSAFAKLQAPCHLIILGSGSLENQLRQQASTLGIANKVFFLGFHANPFKFLYRSQCFVFSSDWEGFGNVLVEAMACGLPVISTDCPSGPREIIAPNTTPSFDRPHLVEQAKYGMLTPTNNADALAAAMTSMLADPELQKHYRERCLHRVHEYTIDKVSSAYSKIIESRGVTKTAM